MVTNWGWGRARCNFSFIPIRTISFGAKVIAPPRHTMQPVTPPLPQMTPKCQPSKVQQQLQRNGWLPPHELEAKIVVVSDNAAVGSKPELLPVGTGLVHVVRGHRRQSLLQEKEEELGKGGLNETFDKRMIYFCMKLLFHINSQLMTINNERSRTYWPKILFVENGKFIGRRRLTKKIHRILGICQR